MLGGVNHKKGRIFQRFFPRLNGLRHKKGRMFKNLTEGMESMVIDLDVVRLGMKEKDKSKPDSG